jgi:Domain of unknown function (DUF3303)
MLFICEYTWQPKTTADQVRARMKTQHKEGTNHPERFKGYYGLAGGGAGFILVEVDDHRDLTEMLQPYMDLVSWDVRAIYPIDYNERIRG